MTRKNGNCRRSCASATTIMSPASCYCNGSREVGTLELFCNGCNRWFHGRCLRYLTNFYALPFMVCYTFHCTDCSSTKQETWTPKQANFSHMLITALANLSWKRSETGSEDKWFSLQYDIVPYFNENWENLTSMPRRVKNTWHLTLQKALCKDTDLFVSKRGKWSDENDVYYGLAEQDLSLIGPNNEVVKQMGRKTVGEKLTEKADIEPPEGPKTRGASKRKATTESQSVNVKRNKSTNDYTSTKFSGYAYPVDHPFNRDGYRYFLVDPDIHAPNRKEFEELEETAGKPIPAYMYRMVRPVKVELSSHDRAPQLKLSEDMTTATGHEGYSVVRATHPVSTGKWYYELELLSQPSGTHARIGWSQALGVLQAPVGYDKFSYAWRSRKGTVFHDSIGRHYADRGFSSTDIIGCLISLPPLSPNQPSSDYLPPSHKSLPLIKFKNHYYYEEKDEPRKAVAALKPLPASRMEFFRNGQSFGHAFVDILQGQYYPAISLYKNCSVKCNFGPNFRFPPSVSGVRPMSEKAEELLVEQALADMLFFIENEGKLKLVQ